MTISKGTAKVVAYAKETTWGVPAAVGTGKQLRRVTADFNLTKEAFESGEIRTDRQVADFRHGVRSAEGTLNGELSPRTYTDFIGSILARDFTTVSPITALELTIAAAGSLWTITRAAGSFITGGVRVGNVVRLSGANLNALNTNKNLLVVSMTATVLTVRVLNGTDLFAQAAAAASTITVVGRETFVPASGHTDDSYTVEQWFSDIAQSEVFTGMKVNSVSVQLPSTGLTTVDIGFTGKDLQVKGTTQYFTAPAAQGTDGIFAAVNGAMIVNGQPVALITSADFAIERATENATAVGSNSIAEVFTGRIRVTGNLSVYFQDAAFRGYFDDETPVSLVMTLTTSNAGNADFMSFVLPKVKVNSFTLSDGELGLTASVAFQALLNDVTGTGLEQTTILVQDSTV